MPSSCAASGAAVPRWQVSGRSSCGRRPAAEPPAGRHRPAALPGRIHRRAVAAGDGTYQSRPFRVPSAHRVGSRRRTDGGDPNVRQPLHAIIAGRVEARIRAGEWAPGDRLPPERELCRDLAVSRATLRQALGALEQRGRVTRHQGRGTFVAPPGGPAGPAIEGRGDEARRDASATGSSSSPGRPASPRPAPGDSRPKGRASSSRRAPPITARGSSRRSPPAAARLPSCTAELTDEGQVDAAVDAAVARFGRLDGLFAVAGGSGRRFGDGPLHEVTLEGWTTDARPEPDQPVPGRPGGPAPAPRPGPEHERAPAARSSSWGASSPATPCPASSPPTPTPPRRARLESLVTTTAAFYAPHAIRVNAVTPGLVATPMSARAAGGSRHGRLRRPQAAPGRRLPAPRRGRPTPPSTSSPTSPGTSPARSSPSTAAGPWSRRPRKADRRASPTCRGRGPSHGAERAGGRARGDRWPSRRAAGRRVSRRPLRYAAAILPSGRMPPRRSAARTGRGGANVREIVGFVMGAAAGAAGALFATSTEGRALLERLKDEARPEVERAATEWEPVLREVGRAVRLAARELEAATVDLRARIGEIAADRPDDEVALAMAEPVPAPRRRRRRPSTDRRAADRPRRRADRRRRRPRRRAGVHTVAAAPGETDHAPLLRPGRRQHPDDPGRPLPLLADQGRLHRPVHRRCGSRGRPSRSGRTRCSRSSSWPSSSRSWGRSSGRSSWC